MQPQNRYRLFRRFPVYPALIRGWLSRGFFNELMELEAFKTSLAFSCFKRARFHSFSSNRLMPVRR